MFYSFLNLVDNDTKQIDAIYTRLLQLRSWEEIDQTHKYKRITSFLFTNTKLYGVKVVILCEYVKLIV